MYYQYTGQPGHGKTVLAIEFALDMKTKADKLHEEDPAKHPLRELYVCNVRDFNHGACGALELTPDEVRTWHSDPRFDHAIILVDEAYEHGMFARRPPGRPVPEHVQQVAKHRHRGIDFVMICQSPKKQMDDFLHDLIEEHYHIRRRYGLPFAHVKRWDRFEANPDKADSLTTSRRKYPKHIFKLYTSTKYDTSEKRVPWFYWAILALGLFVLIFGYFAVGGVFGKFDKESGLSSKPAAAATDGNGAEAKVPAGAAPFAQSSQRKWQTEQEYITDHIPRVPSMPWSAPAYDGASVTVNPQLFCMSSQPGLDGEGRLGERSCRCVTEQGTAYILPRHQCEYIARNGGAYNPYRQVAAEQHGATGSLPSNAVASAEPERSAPVTAAPGADVVIRVGERPMSTFPESVQNRYSGN